jgi:hypothetical protein
MNHAENSYFLRGAGTLPFFTDKICQRIFIEKLFEIIVTLLSLRS